MNASTEFVKIDCDKIDQEIEQTDVIALTSGTEAVGYFNGRLTYRDVDRVTRISVKESIPIVRRLYEGDLLDGCTDFRAVARWLRAVERVMND